MPQVTFNGTKINVEFTESSSRQQLNSGENISTLFGKIKKIFSDLKAVCFSGSYNDLSDKPSSLPANGGNADTVDGHHVDSVIHASVHIPPEYISEFLRINDDTKSIERWSTDNLKVAVAKNATNAENADTLNGMSAETIRSMSKNVKSGTSVSSQLADGTYCGVWSDAPSGLTDTQGTLIVSNYNTNGAPSPWSHRTFYSPHYNIIWHGFTANYNWYGWKEISTTPIKSTTFSATADGTGNFNLWAPSENKVPISIQLDNKTFYAVPFLYNNQVWLGSTINEVTRQPVIDTTVSGTVYYIEV